jgi:exodeoxyribonuclease VII large subunit
VLRPEDAQRPFTVSELANEVKRALHPLSSVLVKGEVSGMKQSARGHYSFTVRDAASVIEAMIWADTARRLPALPEDGQEFIFRGRIDFWSQGGRLRLIVDYLEFDDVGKLRARLELLKRRLEQEGALEPGRKRPIPFLPTRVALVTSPTGAVIHDLQQTIWDRFPSMEILVYPAQVQGMASPASVASAVRRCNQEGLADVLVIARGGGSFEELYAFNTEPVARAILTSRIPVVTALGHTSDRTVADMVADAECRTPTEAGARVVPRRQDLIEQLEERSRRLEREAVLRLRAEGERLQGLDLRLRQVLPALLRGPAERLARCRAEVARLSPLAQVAAREEGLRARSDRLSLATQRQIQVRVTELAQRRVLERAGRAVQARLQAAAVAFDERRQRLEALSPEAVLARGYSITQDGLTGKVIRSTAETAAGRGIRVRLAAGGLRATVDETNS